MAETEFAGSILTELHHRLEDLPKALGRVAQYVLTNPEKVVHQSLVEVSQHSGSGQASVIRLAQSLGLDGYGAFKLALNSELSRCDATMVTDGSAVHQIAGTLAKKAISDVTATARLMDDGKINRVAERIGQLNQVSIFGSGVSGVCGELLHYRLLRQGYASAIFHDPITALEVVAASHNPGVAVAISDSGRTPHAIDFLRNARAAGLYTVAISSRSKSTLADYADTLLQTANEGGADWQSYIVGPVARNALVIETLAQVLGSRSTVERG